MGRKTEITGKIILEALSKYKIIEGETSKEYYRRLVDLIYKNDKKHFTDKEHVRKRLLYYTGRLGEKYRKYSRTNIGRSSAKILVFDIETAPILSYVWGIWNQNVGLNQIVHEWFCFSWAAKWLFEDKVYHGVLTSEEAKSQNDSRIMKSMWELLNEADIVITHNGDKFDIPKLNTRFLVHGMNPPLPYVSIDTLKQLRKTFKFTSNKLDYVNLQLGLHRKMENGGFELWDSCYKGNTQALKKMVDYNVKDVKILEELYLKIRPWIKSHPNIGLHIADNVQCCPTCGSEDLKFEGTYHTATNVFNSFRCNSCGAIGRSRESILNKTRKKFITHSIAR
jgi:DNA polymerase elongation subunit (family B)